MSLKVINRSLVVLVVILALWDRTAAQTSGCTSSLISLSPCLSYVTGNVSTPTSSCCSQLSNVVQSQPQCLCALVNGGSSPIAGMNINQTLALALPGACNVQTPPSSRCNSGPSPSTPAPAGSPSESPSSESPSDDVPVEGPSDSSEPDVPSGPGSRTGRTTNGDVNGSNISATFSFSSILFLMASSWIFSGIRF